MAKPFWRNADTKLRDYVLQHTNDCTHVVMELEGRAYSWAVEDVPAVAKSIRQAADGTWTGEGNIEAWPQGDEVAVSCVPFTATNVDGRVKLHAPKGFLILKTEARAFADDMEMVMREAAEFKRKGRATP